VYRHRDVARGAMVNQFAVIANSKLLVFLELERVSMTVHTVRLITEPGSAAVFWVMVLLNTPNHSFVVVGALWIQKSQHRN
jgi:hypothetical protein